MGKGGKIDVYMDCNSPYSYFTYHHLLRNRPALKQHAIEIEMHPIFLGGLNVGSGNKPPWTLPAKAALGKYELARAMRYFDVQGLEAPGFFPVRSLVPMRCFLYVKEHHSNDVFEACFGELWEMLWKRPHRDVSKPEVLREGLRKWFNEDELTKVIAAGSDPKYKKLLTDETDMLVKKGAFGAPWFQVTNSEGVEEPFFGSDRFHFIYQFLGVPFQDIEILSPGKGSKL